mgnify:CR=1 FL=1
MAVTLASRAAFARMHGVSKNAVSKWETRGAVVVVDGQISVEASDRLLMHGGLGRFSDRPRKPQPAGHAEPSVPPAATAAAGLAADAGDLPSGVLMPLAANLLVSYFNRICAFAGLAAWEHGASVEAAKQTDATFRVLAMGVVTDLLTEIDVERPTDFSWEEQLLWDPTKMAQIDWAAVERPTPDGEPAA